MSRIIAWWSGGIASAVACDLTLKEFGETHEVEIVFVDTFNEHEDTYRFLKDCEKHYGQKIVTLTNERYTTIEEVWRRYNSLNVSRGAICSSELKKNVRVAYQDVENDFAQIFGFDDSAQEQIRAKNMLKNYPEINPLFPLIDQKYDKDKCIAEVQSWEIEMPWAYRAGFRNNNCFRTGCVQGGIGYWQKIAREYPDKFEKMAAMEHELTEARGKPVTMLRDRTGGVRNPLFLKRHPGYPEIRELSEKKGREPEPLMECNGFCSTEDKPRISDVVMKEIEALRAGIL